MVSVTLKRISVHGVEYVTVDEDSPLLPKRSDQESETGSSMNCRTALIVGIFIACTVGILGLIPTKHFYWAPFVRRGRVIQASTAEEEVTTQDTPFAFQRARVLVPEDRPNVPSFWNYAERGPIDVTFDERSIMLNGERALFLSGSLHPVRATPETWATALDEAVRQGLNMVTIYVFWAAHQPFPGMDFDWSFPGNWDLASAIRAVANRGLFCHIRIGPYVCAEYNYGGIPEWVALDQPNMVMRRLNQEWMDAMEKFVVEIVRYLTEEKLWAYQGGPIVMSQIENELDGEDFASDTSRLLKVNEDISPESFRPPTLQDYANWCGDLAARVEPKVVWTMCNGLTAPNAINTCNGYGNTACSTIWLEILGQSGRIQVDQPALWTEDEQGFQIWGDEPSYPSDYFWGSTARQMAREGMQWFARGGSHLNYYMWWGGYNRGRTAAAGIMNKYASDACLCSSGQQRQPKYGHFQDFHDAIISIAPILMNAKTALDKAQVIEYKTDDGEWKVGSKQRMYVYNGNAGEEVIFLENDAETNVKVRFPVSQIGDEQTMELNSLSAVLVVDGVLTFDSSAINPRHKQYKRNTIGNAVKLLDWQTWSEPRGADAKDEHTVVSSAPIEQTALMMNSRTSSDYAWYETDINLSEDLMRGTIQIGTQRANAMSVFLDGHFIGATENHEHAEGNITLSVSMGMVPAGEHKLSFLSESLGYHNLIGRWGAGTQAKTKGITGDIVILGNSDGIQHQAFTQSLVDGREWRSYPGLHEEGRGEGKPRDGRELKTPGSQSSPCSWSSAVFDSPSYNAGIQGLFLDIISGRGHIWLNGYDLGRFWNITRGATDEYSQRYYALPDDLLYANGTLNELIIFNGLGGDNSATNLALSWLEMDEESVMEDEVDFACACL